MRFSQARTEVFLILQNVRFILFLRKTERNNFIEISKNLVRYRFKNNYNNFVGPLK